MHGVCQVIFPAHLNSWSTAGYRLLHLSRQKRGDVGIECGKYRHSIDSITAATMSDYSRTTVRTAQRSREVTAGGRQVRKNTEHRKQKFEPVIRQHSSLPVCEDGTRNLESSLNISVSHQGMPCNMELLVERIESKGGEQTIQGALLCRTPTMNKSCTTGAAFQAQSNMFFGKSRVVTAQRFQLIAPRHAFMPQLLDDRSSQNLTQKFTLRCTMMPMQ